VYNRSVTRNIDLTDRYFWCFFWYLKIAKSVNQIVSTKSNFAYTIDLQ